MKSGLIKQMVEIPEALASTAFNLAATLGADPSKFHRLELHFPNKGARDAFDIAMMEAIEDYEVRQQSKGLQGDYLVDQ